MATYDADKLAILSGNIHVKDIKQFLPPLARGIVTHFTTQVEKTTDDIAAEFASESFPRPFWDPVLKRSPRSWRTFSVVFTAAGCSLSGRL